MKIIYVNCGERNKYGSDLLSIEHILSSSETTAWKRIRPAQDFNPLPLRYRCSTLPTELKSRPLRWFQINPWSINIWKSHMWKEWICMSSGFLKFPINVKVLWPGSRISPDNGFQSPPTQPSSLLMLLANHLQRASIIMVPLTKSFSFCFLSNFLTSQRWHVIPQLLCSSSSCVLETDPSIIYGTEVPSTRGWCHLCKVEVHACCCFHLPPVVVLLHFYNYEECNCTSLAS